MCINWKISRLFASMASRYNNDDYYSIKRGERKVDRVISTELSKNGSEKGAEARKEKESLFRKY